MLPPGHLAAGYLASSALLKLFGTDLSAAEAGRLVWWGLFWSFAPDLDNFVAYLKVKAWWYKPGVDSGIHRKFYSHVPLVWFFAGLLFYLFGQSDFWKMFGVMVWAGSWTHFILDSIEYGIKWFWPFSGKLLALKNAGVGRVIEAENFLDYWVKFLKFYCSTWTFKLEAVILTVFLIFKFL